MTTADTLHGSFARPAAPTQAAAVSSTASESILDSRADRPAVLPESIPGPVAGATAGWLARVQRAFDRWCESNAQDRAEARIWDIARSDPRIMSDLMHARMRDERESASEPLVAPAPAAALVEEAPVSQPPRPSVAGQGWGRMIEDAYQNRFHRSRHQHA